ncbi:MAG: hypothetical protein U0807_13235 [Candidatus Binatia bacterium]
METFLLIVALAVAATAYWPILHSYFFKDDLLCLFRLANDGVGALMAEPGGGHLALVRNGVFALFHWLFGLRAEWYFASVLATHLLNVALLFVVLRRLTGSAWLACAAAALWGACPVLEGALGWYAVYGQVLGATCLLAVLVSLAGYVRARRMTDGWTAAGWLAALVVGAACFGTGIAAAVVFPVVAILVGGRRGFSGPARRVLYAIPLAVAVVFAAKVVQERFAAPDLPVEAILLGGMAVSIPAVLAMTGHLVGTGAVALLTGGPFGGLEYPHLGAIVVLIAAALLVGGAGVRCRREERRVLAAWLVLAVATYGIVAAGRALLFRAFGFSLVQAAAEPRYHYAATVPITMVLAMAIRQFATGRLRVVVASVVVTLAAAGAVRSSQRIDLHEEARREVGRALEELQAAAARVPPGGVVVIQNHPLQSTGVMMRLAEGVPFPGLLGVFVIFFPDDAIDGRPVRFAVLPGSPAHAIRTGRTPHLVLAPLATRRRGDGTPHTPGTAA